MRKNRIIFIFTLLLMHCTNVENNEKEDKETNTEPEYQLLYENVTGTYYNAVEEQTNSEPTITGSRNKIDINKASELRWIAISQVMLDDEFRRNLIKNNINDNRFNGKIKYGDTIWIESPYPEINGWWVANDAMNKRYTKRIDFLQTIGDTTLKRGLFKNIKIFKVKNIHYSEIKQ
ncbi:MAG: hypothetical protein ACOC22_03220 [bacterium]